ncbi:MAG: DUF2461 domain-containing protein [Rikenellaceae bacterium]
MDEILKFLEDLKSNNNREWFQTNIERYRSAQKKFDSLAMTIMSGIAAFDNSVMGLQLKECTYRIYRDVRFSPNKEPYKTHMGVYVCPKGKKSGFAGYYFHLEPDNHSLLAVGLHCPEPKVVGSVRDEIFDNGDEFLKSIEESNAFIIDQSSKLKRVPKGYPADSKYVEYLKLKEFDLIKAVSIDENTISRALSDFKSASHFVQILNRAVSYAKEN